jgi:Trk-type K+ transport system membrane component
MVFENTVLRRVFGPKRDKVTGEWRRIHNEELNDALFFFFFFFFFLLLLLLLLLLLEALQLQGNFGLLNEFPPFDAVSDAVLPVCYFHPYYVALYIILPSIFRSF